MSDLIKSQGGVMVFYLLVILIPQFLYFEISFWARGKNYSPKMTESLLVGLLVSLVVVGYWLTHGGWGESGFAFVAFSPVFVLFFTIIGLSGGMIYKSRGVSLFKKMPLDRKDI